MFYQVQESRRVARIWKSGGLFWKSKKSANDLDPNLHCTWVSFTRFVRKFRPNFSESSETRRFFPPKIRWSPKKKKKGLRRNWAWFFGRSPKFKGFFRPKSGVSEKKKKVFAEIEPDFSAKVRNSKVFSALNQVVSEKKKQVFAEIEPDFSAQIRNSKAFSAQNQVVFKKKGLRRNWAWFFGPNPKSKRLRGGLFSYGGGLFSIFHKKSASKALKTCDFAYFTSQWGGSSPPAPPWLRYCKKAKFRLLNYFCTLTHSPIIFSDYALTAKANFAKILLCGQPYFREHGLSSIFGIRAFEKFKQILLGSDYHNVNCRRLVLAQICTGRLQ